MGAGLTWKSQHYYTCSSVAHSHHNFPCHLIFQQGAEELYLGLQDAEEAVQRRGPDLHEVRTLGLGRVTRGSVRVFRLGNVNLDLDAANDSEVMRLC